MNDKDLELATKIGQLASRFPEEWQEYQEWLRAIMSSRLGLQQRYSTGLASFVFRWRLIYFSLYFLGAIGFGQFLNILKRKGESKSNPVLESGEIAAQPVVFSRSNFILHRMATLLAVSELTLCGVAAFTGVMLAFYYQPTAVGAHVSLNEITVGNGRYQR